MKILKCQYDFLQALIIGFNKKNPSYYYKHNKIN